MRIAVDEGSLNVVERGAGPTVVFVHGTPSGAHEFEEAMALLPDHRCLAPEHLGFGASDKPPGADYGLEAQQRRFAAALDALEVESAVFVLHDFGAAFALPALLDRPERVRGIVLANTFLWPATGAMRWVLRFYASPLGRWLYRALNLSAGWLLPWAWGTHRPLTRERHQVYLAPFPTPADRHAVAALPGALIGPGLEALAHRAPELGAFPIRAVWGLADPLVGPADLDRWRALIEGLEVDTVQRAGHFVADEAPDVLAAAVRTVEEVACRRSPPLAC